MSDRRLNRSYSVIDAAGKSLGEWMLVRKIGPGHFLGEQEGRQEEIFSCQLRGETR